VLTAVHYGDDNAVRSLSDAQLAAATPDEKAVLVRHLIGGFTGNDDERAILRILRTEAGDVARFDRIINIVGMRNLVDNIQGGEGAEFRKLVASVRLNNLKPGDWNSYQNYLDTVTGTKVSEGNKITLLNGGELAFNTMFSAIDNAKNSVNWEMYQLHNDKTGHDMVEHLIAAAQRGVTVNVLLDGFGDFTKKNGELVDLLKQNGVNVIVNPFPVNEISIDHRKLLVIDGQLGLTGGMNTGDKYRYEISDLFSKIEGPAVADMQRAFMRRWTEEGGTIKDNARYFPALAAQGEQKLRVVAHNPHEDENIRNVYLRAIDTSVKSITIQDPFFHDTEVIKHLEAAAKRGVDVKIVLPAQNLFIDRDASRAFYQELLAAGVKVFEYQPSFAHEKVAVIDGQWATIGSSNLDARSLNSNHELNVVTVDKKFAATLQQAIDEDIAKSKQITKPVGNWLQRLEQKVLSRLEKFI
jgi:cardiolipin synthase A/B